MSEMFKQCELTKPVDGGLARMISWIPAHIAVLNAIVALKDSESGERTAGWRVANVTEPAVPAKLLERQSRDYLRTRNASDI
ncbi:MAG TPA: hypothetical protein VG269_07580 [Tepidisphaeraceae bacterium]|nr:hypothetical protein [Tepidisphaeraceae bacterium]